MNVLHLVAGELSDGAGRGAYWLHRGLREIGIDSHVLTNGRETYGDPCVTSICRNGGDKVKYASLYHIGNLPVYLYPAREKYIFNTGIAGIDITKHPLYSSADIIHLHWINGLVNMHTLKKVKKPVIWTIRDMWPITGGCHIALDCDRYKNGCGRCPQLGGLKKYDLSRLIVIYKKQMLPSSIIVVGISEWISNCAMLSEVFKRKKVLTIHNNIDTEEFLPINKNIARSLLSVSKGKKYILIGSANINDKWKGLDIFMDALDFLDKDNIHLLIFGNGSEEVLKKKNISFTLLGYLKDTLTLRVAYSAADVFVAPSRMDAFGKTLAESMACGTPVVCFDATGPKDIVEHKVSGYKAFAFDPQDLAAGIKWVLSRNEDIYSELCVSARKRVVEYFDSKVIAQRYKALYNEIMNISY